MIVSGSMLYFSATKHVGLEGMKMDGERVSEE
jgi:hypothetical protein